MAQKDNKVSSTSILFRRIFKTNDIGKFLERNSDALGIPSFHCYISEFCKTKGLIPEQVILHSDIERTYGHQLFNGTRKPSRDKALQLAFGLGLDVEGAQKLLQVAQKSLLYPKIKRDAAILFCINQQKDIYETQSVLHSLGLTLLGDE